MGKNYGLTNTEMEIMEFLWKSQGEISYKELFDFFNGKCKKGWKKQTLSTYLTKLQKSGLIAADSRQKHYHYYPLHTKEEYIEQWTRQFIEKSFSSTISKFVAAFVGFEKISKEEAEELKRLIDASIEDD